MRHRRRGRFRAGPRHGPARAQGFGDLTSRVVIPDKQGGVPERGLGPEIGTETVPHPRGQPHGGKRQDGMDECPDHAVDVRAALVDLLVQAHFAKHALGQRAVNRDDGAGLADFDQAHGFGRADENILLIQSGAHMPIGVTKVMARAALRTRIAVCSRGSPGCPKACVVMVVARQSSENSGMLGRAPHMQKDSFLKGSWRGRQFSSTFRTPEEYS